jgi:hypothetical protein
MWCLLEYFFMCMSFCISKFGHHKNWTLCGDRKRRISVCVASNGGIFVCGDHPRKTSGRNPVRIPAGSFRCSGADPHRKTPECRRSLLAAVVIIFSISKIINSIIIWSKTANYTHKRNLKKLFLKRHLLNSF